MSQTPPAAEATVEGQMFLFRKPELLTREQHGGMGITRPDQPVSFAAKARAVPLTLSEITTAMRDYPIIFTSSDNPQPLAVLGLLDDINLFVNDEGEWDPNTYIPGYIRRYPFALATDRQSDTANPRMAMIVDAEYEGIATGADIPFFDGEQPSEAMKQAMEFCQNYEQDRLQTNRFAQELASYDLLAQQMAQFTPEGQQAQPFAQYIGIEEKRLQDMPDEKFLELRKTGLLPVFYAQLMSMNNWRSLLDRRARRFDLTGDAVLKPLATS